MIHQVNKARLYDTSYEALPPSLTQLVLKLWSSQWRNEIPSFSLFLIFWQRKVFLAASCRRRFLWRTRDGRGEEKVLQFAVCRLSKSLLSFYVLLLLRTFLSLSHHKLASFWSTWSQRGLWLSCSRQWCFWWISMLFGSRHGCCWAPSALQTLANHLFQFRSNEAGLEMFGSLMVEIKSNCW